MMGHRGSEGNGSSAQSHPVVRHREACTLGVSAVRDASSLLSSICYGRGAVLSCILSNQRLLTRMYCVVILNSGQLNEKWCSVSITLFILHVIERI